MAKKTFQDVVPPQDGGRRSIRDIPVMRRPNRNVYTPDGRVEEEIKETPKESPIKINSYQNPKEENTIGNNSINLDKFTPKKNSKMPSSKIFIGLSVVAIGIFIFVMMNAFTSANIEITPKKQDVSFNLAVKAYSATGSAASSSMLKYEVIQLSSSEEKDVPASGEEQVSNKASAKIFIYNNFSGNPERLIARTRFQTTDGLIFRIADSVVVPGKTSTGPGSVEVTVYADEPGDKYNVGLEDFTIPGFKDDAARFKGIYARSKTPATGGFVGNVKKVADSDKQAALADLQEPLKQDLDKQLASKLDPNLVVLDGGLLYDFNQEVVGGDASTSGSNATIKENGDLYAIAFNKEELDSLIESQFLKDWQGLPSTIDSYDKVSITFDTLNWRPSISDTVSIKIAGDSTFVASIDKSSLANSLAGKDKSELAKLVEQSKSIESAKASIRPVWKSKFPSDVSKIKVDIAK